MKCKNKKVFFIYLFLTTLSLRLAYIQYLLKHLYYQKISFKQNGSKIYTKYSRFTVVSVSFKENCYYLNIYTRYSYFYCCLIIYTIYQHTVCGGNQKIYIGTQSKCKKQ